LTGARDDAAIAALGAALAEQSARLAAMERQLGLLSGLVQSAFLAGRSEVLAGIVAADGRHADPLSLARSHGRVHSQNGEDGMIAEIFRRIGARDRFFVEIGVENGRQCNTRLLLEAGWRGCWIEGSPQSALEAAQLFRSHVESGALDIVSAMVAPDNVDAVLDRLRVPATFDFLSLDIDQHTHCVWRALRRRARVACIEYNASVPPSLPLEVPYDGAAAWDGSNWFGAGLKAMELIGTAKDMALVGCDLAGVNAFFVARDEATGRFRAPFTAETHHQPPCYFFAADAGHPSSPSARRWVTAAEAAVPGMDGDRPDRPGGHASAI
jgi:hypothetical protein